MLIVGNNIIKNFSIGSLILTTMMILGYSVATADTRGRVAGEKSYEVNFACPKVTVTLSLTNFKNVTSVKVVHDTGAEFDLTAASVGFFDKVKFVEDIGIVCVSSYPSFNLSLYVKCPPIFGQ